MIKKIALASTLLLGTLLNAEIQQNGFFVGVDLGQRDSRIEYDNNANGSLTNMTTNPYTNDVSDSSTSLKMGYQYYVTRIYARYSGFNYKDEQRDKYTIKGELYEINVDYTPVFYTNKAKTWNVRGIFGAGVGFNSSKMSEYDLGLIPAGETAGSTQSYMEYGYQIGVLSETSIGLSLEAAYRVRYGNLQEITDSSNRATFSLETKEIYLGLNYLF